MTLSEYAKLNDVTIKELIAATGKTRTCLSNWAKSNDVILRSAVHSIKYIRIIKQIK